MTDHRVGSLRVHLRTHGVPPSELPAEARAFAEALLQAIADRLEARAGGKHVRIRRLPLRLRARRELFADRMEIDRMADDIAASITWTDAGPPWDGDVLVFEDEVAWRAASLVELARGGGRVWCFQPLADEPDGIAGLTSLSPPAVREVLARVARANALDALLERVPANTIAALADALAIVGAPRTSSPGTVPVPSVARELVAAIRAAVVPHAAPTATAAPAGSHASSADEASRETSAAQAQAARDLTRHAGLVYMVRCLLELDAGEILWRACVPEQQVLAVVLASMIDFADDPAPALLAGAPPAQPFAASPAQRDEIVAALCASLYAALPRRGLAEYPVVELQLVETRHGRALFALADGSPIFAVPTPAIADAAAGIARFLRAWPEGTIGAPAALVELTRDARIQLRNSATSARIASHALLDRDAALIADVTAGCATALFRARAGTPDLATRGLIHDEDDRRIVTMSIEAVQIAVRRAGLDRDPGWVPWLQRSLAIVFEE